MVGTERREVSPVHSQFGLEDLEQEYASVIALLDEAAALRQATARTRQLLGVDLGIAAEVVDDIDTLVFRTISGARTGALHGLVVPAGTGVAGKVATLRRPVVVPDYHACEDITHEFDPAIRVEGIRAILAVPIMRGHEFHGVLFGANRSVSEFGERDIETLLRLARQTGLALDIARRAQDMATVAVEEERSRIALALHDTVGATLFGITAAARDIASGTDCDRLRGRLQFIQEQAASSAAALRQALLDLSVTSEDVALGVGLKRACRAFQERTDVEARVVLLGDLPWIDEGRARVLLDAAREALLNVEKHAQARSVVVSGFTAEDGLAVAVADDGVGRSAKRPAVGLGLAATAERLAEVGGRLVVSDNEDGGTTVRVWVPC